MKEQINWYFVLVIFLSLLGFIVSLILYIANRNKSFSPRILAAIIFCISYSLFGYGLYFSGEFLHFPHLWRTPVFLSLCVAPLTYIYVRSVLQQAFRFRKSDFLFFLPAFLYTAQLIPFYMLPASMKLPFIEKAMQSKFFGAREPEGLLPVGFGFLFRMIYSLGMIGVTYILLIRWKRSSAGKILEIRHNNEIFRWLLYLTIVLSSTFFVLIIGQLLHLSRIFEQYRIPSLTVTLTIFFICSYLLFKPNILYGLEGWLPIQVTADLPEISFPISEPVTKSQSISLEQGIEYKQTIEDHFKKNLPFLKHRYTIRDLSNEVDIPSYLLSAFINQEYGKNFSEFVNENRISYLIEFTAQNPDSLLQYTLEVLGQMGGFKSRAAFIAAVKRKTGKTPSEVFGNKT